MNILFWLEPHFELASPGIMATWLQWYEHIAANIAAAGVESQARIVALDAPPARNRLDALGDQLIVLSQGDLRANWAIDGDVFMALEHDTLPDGQIKALQTQLAERLAGFEPDFVFLHNQQPWLRRLFANAVFVNIEASWTSRPPFPMSWHLDIAGAGKGQVLALHADKLLPEIDLDEAARAWLDNIGMMARQAQHSPQAESAVLSLRKRYDQVVLLPLGLFDRYDGRTGLFCVLDEYFAQMDGKNSFILTQHPLRGVLTPEQMTCLSSRYPWLVDGSGMGSQNLLPLVDRVVADFSTLATQALFFGTRVTSIRRGLRHFPAETSLRNPLADLLQDADSDTRQRALYWLLRHYAVPERRLFDGAWLAAFLETARAAHNYGRPWDAYAQSTADAADWAPACWRRPVGSLPIETSSLPPSIGSNAKDSKMTNDRVAYEQASAALAAGDTEAAVVTLSQLAESGTDLWEVYNDLGALAVQQADLDTAITLFEFAVARESKPGPAHLHLAQTQEMIGQPLAALETLSPVLRNNRELPEALPTLRRLIGTLPELPPVAWARLLADLQVPNAELRVQLDQAAQLAAENARLQRTLEQVRALLCAGQTVRADPAEGTASWETINLLPDDQWLDILIGSVSQPSYRGYPLPSFPAENLQVGTVGSSNETALREGFNFYRTVKSECIKHGLRFRPGLRLLDFGTGWGRYARIFQKEFRPDDILGVDVDSSFIDVCKRTFPYGSFETVPSAPPTQIPANSFDLVIAYSVFSHLAEATATAWIAEFARILKPGGMIAVTTQGRSFLRFCEDIRRSGKFDHPWHQNLARSFVDLPACEAAYDHGEFLFSPTGGGDARPSTFYGEALIPEGFVRNVWSAWLEPLEFIDDRQCLPQALIIMRKRM